MIQNSDLQFLSPKNYLLSPGIETGRQGWGLFNTTLTSKIPTGGITSGAASITTFAPTTTNPLSGDYSLRVASSGAITAGHGFISDVFLIDRQDKAKVLGFSFSYEPISGTMDFSGTSANTWAVYIYDVDNSAWIQPAGVYNLVQSSGVGIASGTFQTTSNGTQYRIAIVCITATAGAVEIVFDGFSVNQQRVVFGSPITDWQSYTPVMTGGSASAISGRWRRVGDSIHARVVATLSAGGVYQLTVPFPADSSKFPNNQINVIYGMAVYGDTSANVSYTGGAYFTSTTTVRFYGPANTEWSAVNPVAFGAGDGISLDIVYPAAGLSSSVQMSNDTDTRVVAVSVYPAAAQPALTTSVSTKVLFDTINFPDTHGAFDFANDWYRVPVSGYYNVNATVAFATNNVGARAIGYRIDGGFVRWMSSYQASSGDFTRCTGSAVAYLNAGSYVEIFAFQNSGGNLAIVAGPDFTQFSMNRLSGPATIAANETCSASYSTSAAPSIPNNSATPIVYPTKTFDTHSMMNASTGVVTIPVSGLFEVKASHYFGSAIAATATDIQTLCRKNGVTVQGVNFTKSGTALTPLVTSGSFLVKCNAGDTIQIFLFQANSAGTAQALLPNNEFNWMSINRVGN